MICSVKGLLGATNLAKADQFEGWTRYDQWKYGCITDILIMRDR